jgi:ATP-dependent DNA ligase
LQWPASIQPWSFEPKWDGFRTIVFRDGDQVELGSRNERPLTRYFPELVEAVKAHLPTLCVVDAEIVVPDQEGRRLDFDALPLRIHPAASGSPCSLSRRRLGWSPSTCSPG